MCSSQIVLLGLKLRKPLKLEYYLSIAHHIVWCCCMVRFPLAPSPFVLIKDFETEEAKICQSRK